MTNLITFIIIVYGASNIMVFSTIFKKWRNFFGVSTDDEVEAPFLGKLFGCMMCLPFWWGIIISLIAFSPSLSMMGDKELIVFGYQIPSVIVSTFLDGCLASGAVWFVHTAQEKLEA